MFIVNCHLIVFFYFQVFLYFALHWLLSINENNTAVSTTFVIVIFCYAAFHWNYNNHGVWMHSKMWLDCVGFDSSNGSAAKSAIHNSRSWTACSSFFIVAGWHSACFLLRCWHSRFCFTAAFILVTLFVFLVVENSCFSFCRSWSYPVSAWSWDS